MKKRPRSAARSAAWIRSLFPLLLLLSVGVTGAAPPTTRPEVGLREKPSTSFALQNARITVAPGRVLDQATLVVRDGVIVQVGADVAIPSEAQVLDMAGRHIYPGLIDGFSEAAVNAPPPSEGVPYWNPEVRARLRMAELYKPDKELNEKLRSQGITARLVAPQGGIIKGSSAVVLTSDEENAKAVLQPDAAQHLRLSPAERSRHQYPNSPMGAVALVRQAFYDAQWYQQAWATYNAQQNLPRPERTQDLEILHESLAGEPLVVIDAPNELYLLRADRLAREFSLRMAVRGSGREYRRVAEVAASGRAVIVPLNFPKAPYVATPEAAHNVSLQALMHWDLAPENPARLHRAGVPIVLCTHGLKDPKEFLKAVRRAVHRGLPKDAALEALTVAPARLFGVDDRVGTLEPGKLANFLVLDGELFAEKTQVVETWVAGKRYRTKTEPWFDLRGRWQLTITDPDQRQLSVHLDLKGKPDDLEGSLRRPATEPDKPETSVKLERVQLQTGRLSFSFRSDALDREGISLASAVVTSTDDAAKYQWTGQIIWPDGSRSQLLASGPEPLPDDESQDKKPDAVEPPSPEVDSPSDDDSAEESNSSEATEDEPADENDEEKKDKSDVDPEQDKPASYEPNLPLGAFGRQELPSQPKHVVLRNATIWTCGPAGVLPNAMMLVREGKIVAVGPTVDVPEDALVLDLEGKHVTPGIVDCHSHMATDGGVNESTQSITAEVRIGDFIDADDIDIYRQLAGGVTCANILHGSANAIGGQNQVIKLRWGAGPEQLKMLEAPPGIKFALGENVKQSNWGDEYTTRYPQTRMGVEQIIRDAFQAAREYGERWQQWQQDRTGLPPRKDLELEALREVLQGQRWVHCHSYRQDEILALLRVLDEFEIQIGTLQHVLEGYKVADEMARHGAMGSCFSDWWAYKFEVYDAIPYNGALMHDAGVVVSFNSDDRELARHLNHEAAKAVKYGGVPEEEALKFVTINPARQLRIESYVGSLEPGKHADFVVWSGPPLSTLSRCEQTWVDGRQYFELESDRKLRKQAEEQRQQLIQKILAGKLPMQDPEDVEKEDEELWPQEDVFCHPFHRHGLHGG